MTTESGKVANKNNPPSNQEKSPKIRSIRHQASSSYKKSSTPNKKIRRQVRKSHRRCIGKVDEELGKVVAEIVIVATD